MERARLTPLALRELAAATSWIAKDNRVAARGLRQSIDRALTLIGNHPEIGSPRPELAADPVRFYVLSGYPYLLVYASDRRPPVVMRVIHGARNLEQALGGMTRPS